MASARKIATREAILDRALDLFDARGYDDVRVEDIAQSAGVARATFYNHFADRDEVLGALFRRLLDTAQEGADDGEAVVPARDGVRAEAPDEDGSPLVRIPEVATTAVRRMLQEQRLARLLYSLPFRHEALLEPEADTTPAVFRRIHRLLEAAAARGELRADMPLDLICVHVHNALEAAMRSWAEGHTDDPVERVRCLVELAIHGITARPSS